MGYDWHQNEELSYEGRGEFSPDLVTRCTMYCTVLYCTVLYYYQESEDPDRASQLLSASVPVRGVPGGPRSHHEAS